jgi:hypothetical protein
MTETAVLESFKWVCGKCRGSGLYREDDRLVGDCCIACPICGNRYYNDVGRVSVGVAPVKVRYTPTPAPPPEPNHFTLERTASIATGPGRSGARANEKEEEPMAVRKPCANCGRDLTVVSRGLCFVCYTAGKGLVGEERDAALAAVKAKIGSGGLSRRGGAHRGPRKAAPANTGDNGDMMPHHAPVIPGPVPKPLAAHVDRETTVVAPARGDDESVYTKAPARAVEGTPVIAIDFADERDRKIYGEVITMARSFRRTPEQQILWMLQHSIEQETAHLGYQAAAM